MAVLRPAALLFLLLAALSSGSIPQAAATSSMASYGIGDFAGISRAMTCDGSSCGLFDDGEDMDVEGDRRELMARRRRRYLSYDMLKRNQVPCNRRGVSYYNCNRHGRANPYRRGCSYITRCARDLR
ncbi:hypothetical protein HPP92_002454 [Vanilla planifolia]|uniref:Uncharacterized protein n=1 Tax=Vanilla planifolia TaxID=51239 RepID=A0A835RWM3_VANPL|nr:hypothetical protein HPP92_002854 [Vanilla planifolia]KAG0502382.1 hypothetical protein HPP92_002454 [Vanilla planifolia]